MRGTRAFFFFNELFYPKCHINNCTFQQDQLCKVQHSLDCLSKSQFNGQMVLSMNSWKEFVDLSVDWKDKCIFDAGCSFNTLPLPTEYSAARQTFTSAPILVIFAVQPCPRPYNLSKPINGESFSSAHMCHSLFHSCVWGVVYRAFREYPAGLLEAAMSTDPHGALACRTKGPSGDTFRRKATL